MCVSVASTAPLGAGLLISKTSSGNINSFVDGAGERVVGRGGNVPTSASGQRSSEVAQWGMAELREGLAGLKGGSDNSPHSNAPIPTATKISTPENGPPTTTSTAAPAEAATVPTTSDISKGDPISGQQNPAQTQPDSKAYAGPQETDTAPKTADNVQIPDPHATGEQNPMQEQPTGYEATKPTPEAPPPATSRDHP